MRSSEHGYYLHWWLCITVHVSVLILALKWVLLTRSSIYPYIYISIYLSLRQETGEKPDQCYGLAHDISHLPSLVSSN
ncbi:hypothetical protein BDV27DRAFT_138255 [Aspergillus caelatus]|uniref:Uncharacterized protein n=1 Tax=Aspergillus caelatus TaxID=61420 RepID=A0A5N6ZM68_9EURO|nr:uncharacterized protein BDV27DRAFT_138255 [Aspergillus caelatus]KAE8358076.1 hypothetical protein BDV27DRAFT_138255 [Aspergillus caelatus]